MKNELQNTLDITFHYLADTPEYITTCAQWAFDAWGEYNPAITKEIRIERFHEHCNKDDTPLTIICKINDEVIGMASLRANDGLGDELTPWLGSLYIAEKFRSQGIGKVLIKKIENEARNLKFNSLYLLIYEKTLSKWYKAQGWKKIKDDTLYNNPVIVMEKML